ncbi:GNAT family N-acetyltransferase [Aliikangiella sp. IMCC44653]
MMQHEKVACSKRLKISKLNLAYAQFIYTLVNQPEWLQYIGDKGVLSIQDAHNYLQNGPIQSYYEHGFGLYKVTAVGSDLPVGVCGLIKRNGLAYPDLGFALITQYTGQGITTEAAQLVITHVRENLHLTKLMAITSLDNLASQRVLAKLKFNYLEQRVLPGVDDLVKLYVRKL